MKVYLIEALTPKQKAKVDNWEHGDTSFSDHAFESPAHKRTYIELGSNQKGQHEDEITAHLAQHGYTMHSYKDGIAKDKYGRLVKIGKALGKTKGEHLLDKFTGDPVRQQKSASNDDHQVVISRHPHDVAGMTSSGHSWINSSCMNFATGQNKHYLPEDVKHGTHVAYLIHKNDTEIKKPLARIALKPFHEVGGEGKILRPENTQYGNAPDSFQETVNNWAEKHFPAKPESIYKKNSKLYHDSGSKIIAPKTALGKILSHDPALASTVIRQHSWTHEELKHVLDKHAHTILQNISSLPEESAHHILYHVVPQQKDDYEKVGLAADVASRSILTPELHKKLMHIVRTTSGGGYRKNSLERSLLTDENAAPEDVHAALEDYKTSDISDRQHLLRYAKHAAHPKVYEPILKDFELKHTENPTIQSENKARTAATELTNLSESPHLTTEHSHHILNKMIESRNNVKNRFGGMDELKVIGNLIKHPGSFGKNTGYKISTQDLHRVADYYINNHGDSIDDFAYKRLARHPNADASLHDKLFNHLSKHLDGSFYGPDSNRRAADSAMFDVAGEMAKRGNMTPDHINTAIKHFKSGVKNALAGLNFGSRDPFLSKDQLKDILSVKLDTFGAHPGISHLANHPVSLEDQHDIVKSMHPSNLPSFISHTESFHPEVRNILFNHPDSDVSDNYLLHKDATMEHLRSAITGADPRKSQMASHNSKSAPFIPEMLRSHHYETVRNAIFRQELTEAHVDQLHDRLRHGDLGDRSILSDVAGLHFSGDKVQTIAGHPLQPKHTSAIVEGILNTKMKGDSHRIQDLRHVFTYYQGKDPAPLAKAMEFKHEPWFDEDVGLHIAKHPLATRDMLKYLSGSSMHAVRHAVAKHANTPFHVLQDLQNDSKELVRDSAKQNLRFQGLGN